MERTFFEMKQAHLTAIRLGRDFTEPVGLTPARLDMLRAILEYDTSGIPQSQLRRSLCVTKTVISVMARSLERLGFVKRVRHQSDKRTYWVSLTELAKTALRKIFYKSVSQGFLKLALISAFVKLPLDPRNEIMGILQRLRDQLLLFREAYGIGVFNPWEPNDDDDPFYYADVPDNPNAVDLISHEDADELARQAKRFLNAA
jgi:DNA-binding MarR family transcriptional regulator